MRWIAPRPPVAGDAIASCAGGHHFADGLWLRDASVLDDQSEYWFERAGDALYDRRQTDISAHGIDHYSWHRPTSVGPILL